jgi:hypothetical protein
MSKPRARVSRSVTDPNRAFDDLRTTVINQNRAFDDLRITVINQNRAFDDLRYTVVIQNRAFDDLRTVVSDRKNLHDTLRGFGAPVVSHNRLPLRRLPSPSRRSGWRQSYELGVCNSWRLLLSIKCVEL